MREDEEASSCYLFAIQLPKINVSRVANLRQGARTVEDYTIEFYQLISRNEVHETEDQLVNRYIRWLVEGTDLGNCESV